MFNLLKAIITSTLKSAYVIITTHNVNNAFKAFIKTMSEYNIFYVKFIQSLGTNTKYFDSEKRDFLSQYLDSVPYNDNEIDKKFIDTLIEVGNINDNLKIDTDSLKVINAGIIGIVYKGKMNNKDIIVKVMKNNIKKNVYSALDDFESFLFITKYIPVLKFYYLQDLFNSNKPLLIEQLDFKTELENIKKFSINNKNTDYVKIPDVYDEFTNKNNNIIVMEYLHGKKLSQLTKSEKQYNNDLVIMFGIKSILFNRTYHADLHPGNIIFMTDSQKLGVIDYGIVGELNKNEQNDIFNFFKSAFVNKNYYNCAKIITNDLSLKINDNYVSENLLELCNNNLAAILHDIMNNTQSLDPEGLFKLNKQLFSINKKLSQTFCKVEMSIVIADSLSSNLTEPGVYFDIVENITKTLLENM